MINHICDKCIHKIEPTSIKDYYIKTCEIPDMRHWGESEFKHLYWLCDSVGVARIDGVNGSIIHKLCREYNKHSNCTYFRTEDAEDILPSSVEVIANKTEVNVDDELELNVKITPFTISATEITPEIVNTQDINYSYSWYKNGRKLFTKKSNVLKVNTKIASVDEYYCVVEQVINNNGDGGIKTSTVASNKITIIVNKKEDEPTEPLE